MVRNGLLTVAVILALSGESLLGVGLTWTYLERGGTLGNLGALSAMLLLLPYTVRRLMGLQSLVKCLRWGLAYQIVATAVIISWEDGATPSLATVVVLLAGATFNNFGLVFVCEEYFSRLTSVQSLSASSAARLLQTLYHAAAMFGVGSAAWLLNLLGLKLVLAAYLISLAAGLSVSCLYAKRVNDMAAIVTVEGLPESRNRAMVGRRRSHGLLKLSLMAVHVASFNLLMPSIGQRVHAWSAAQFGVVDVVCGVGGVAALLIYAEAAKRDASAIVFAGVLGATGLLLASSRSMYLACLAAFGHGIAMDMLRIDARKALFQPGSDDATRQEQSARIALVILLVKATTPVLLGALADRILPPQVFIAVCGTVGLTIALLARWRDAGETECIDSGTGEVTCASANVE